MVPDLPSNDRFADQYGSAKNQRSGLTWPASECFAVTPNDFIPLLQGPPRGIYCAGAGTVVMDDCLDNQVTITGVTAGSILPIRAKKIYTASTCTGMVALY